jgi:predicted nucleic acid-binding protein
MNQVKVLGIAPYEGMLHQMRQAAAKRDDIALTAFVGDMQTGAAIASRYTPDDFDVILSRGGTAEMIRRQSSLPVVEITLSAYDILRSIKLAETGSGKYAIIGFPAITRNARFLCDMLRYDVDIFTINDEEEARAAMRRLSSDGYAMVLCDMIASSTAQHYGIPAMLINSGQESVELAMEQAVQSSRTYRQLKERMRFFRGIAEAQPQRLLVLDERGEPCYDSHTDPLPAPVLARLHAAIEADPLRRRQAVLLRGRQQALQHYRHPRYDQRADLHRLLPAKRQGRAFAGEIRHPPDRQGGGDRPVFQLLLRHHALLQRGGRGYRPLRRRRDAVVILGNSARGRTRWCAFCTPKAISAARRW